MVVDDHSLVVVVFPPNNEFFNNKHTAEQRGTLLKERGPLLLYNVLKMEKIVLLVYIDQNKFSSLYHNQSCSFLVTGDFCLWGKSVYIVLMDWVQLMESASKLNKDLFISFWKNFGIFDEFSKNVTLKNSIEIGLSKIWQKMKKNHSTCKNQKPYPDPFTNQY